MIAVFAYPAERAEAEQFIADSQPCYVWHDGPVMRVYTGDDIPQDVDTE